MNAEAELNRIAEQRRLADLLRAKRSALIDSLREPKTWRGLRDGSALRRLERIAGRLETLAVALATNGQ